MIDQYFADIFVRRYEGEDAYGRIVSRMEPTGYLPKCAELLRGHGYELPASIYATAGA